MKIHFIAVGGAVMHNMAIALHQKGNEITGSDDEIFEPSRSRLRRYGILPDKRGWNPEKITADLDGVILGMHARKDNPELLKAQGLGIKIWSFPEYIYEQSKNKIRVVIGGSHGKTTITSMVMHVLRFNNYNFDYMVGSQLEGFETMVKLTEDATIIVLEGDEYLSSPLDSRPKFHLYRPHIALLTGIEWDHMNVFPTFENYLKQFSDFTHCIDPKGKLFWFDGDPNLKKITQNLDIENESYAAHPYIPEDNSTYLDTGGKQVSVPFFGKHNMQNISGALHICMELGLPSEQFYEAISSFKGAARRQQLLAEGKGKRVYQDFAHAPSKVRATVKGFRETFPKHNIIACLELHTFSSLSKNFLPQYKGTMDPASKAIVFFNPEVVAHKKLPTIDTDDVKKGFKNEKLIAINDSYQLKELLLASAEGECIILLMTSGSFSGMDMKALAEEIIK
jgi:UDP-N-acetylmuramate: L-alanyl-gamma-D-glutamyl-meso-diaminopimelate ligase